MNEEKIKELIEQIYSGLIHLQYLPLELYLFTANKLLSGVYQGYGYTLTEMVEKQIDYQTLYNLSRNIYHFSAAKTFQNVFDIQSSLYKDGFKVPFSEFKVQAETIFKHYNTDWLKVEYQAAIMGSNSASLWEDYVRQADLLPLLKYQTVGDKRVRPEHASMDGVVRPITDAFWNTYYPPNGWNCRCIVVQLEKGEEPITKLTKEDKERFKKETPEVFRNNPAKSGKVFADHHPYFDVPSYYEDLKKNNFNLPMPI